MAHGELVLKKPNPKQQPFYDSLAPLPCLLGGTGSGKSLIGSQKVVNTCFLAGADALIVTPDFKQGRRGPLEYFLETTQPILQDSRHPYNHNDQVIACYNRKGGITKFWFATGATSRNLYSANVSICYIDEVCLVEPKAQQPHQSEVMKAVVTRSRVPMDPPFHAQTIATGTPEDDGHWSYKVWGDPDRPDKNDTPCWYLTIYDNPFRDPAGDRQIEIITRGDRVFFEQLALGRWRRRTEGLLFREEWFGRYDQLPELIAIVASWDTAGTKESHSSFTVGQLWGITETWDYYLLHMMRDKMDYPFVKEAIRRVDRHWRPRVSLIEAKSTGQPALQELELEGLAVEGVNPGTSDKILRANQSAVVAFEGRIFLPSQELAVEKQMDWLPVFEGELFRVPFSVTWDITDAFSQFINWAELNKGSLQEPEMLSMTSTYGRSAEDEEEMAYARALRR